MIKNKLKIKKIIIAVFFSSALAFVLVSGNITYAQSSYKVYLEAPREVPMDSEVQVSVWVDAPEPINAFDIEISYPKDRLQFLTFDNARSIVDIWQTQAKILADGNIGLSGGLVKPFEGRKGLIINLSFKTSSKGQIKLSVAKSDLYLFDGKGTKVRASGTETSFAVSADAPMTVISLNSASDNTPPEVTLQLVKNPADGTSLLSFNATDKESGVKSIEMRIKKWWSWSAWEPVQNPVFYPSHAWKIELKATNNANMETIRSLGVTTELYKKIFMIFVAISLVFAIVLVYNKRKRRYI